MPRRWLAAAAATGAGMFAVGAIGAGIVPAAPQPMDAGPTATSPPAAKPEVLSTAGGTVLASCAGQRVVVRSASPAQGYQVESEDDEHHGGHGAEVKFSSEDTDIKVKLRCTDGEPRATIEREGDG